MPAPALPQRADNDARRRAGEPLLPEEDPSLPFFRPLPEVRGGKEASLDSLLLSAQIASYCGEVSKVAGSSFGKLYLAGALQK